MNRIKQLIVKLFAWYHRVHLAALWERRRKKESPNSVLTQTQKDEVIAFFKPYCKVSTSSHNFYTEKTGLFYKEYIPDYIYDGYVDPYFNCAEEAVWVDNKCFYEMYFPGIKQPKTLVRRINSFWFVGGQIVSQEQVLKLLQEEPAIFIKEATESMGGHGVTYLENVGSTFMNEMERTISKIKGDIVIQRPIKQHAQLASLNESSVNTIRCLSLLRDNGEVKIYSVILRMGIKGAKVDNASSGGITIGITSEGKLRKNAFSKYGEKYEAHPSSGVVFDGYMLPGYAEVIQSVKMAHLRVPRFRLVSWDFCVDADGNPVLIEANLHRGELDFHQLNNGPVFGEDTPEILQQVFQKH